MRKSLKIKIFKEGCYIITKFYLEGLIIKKWAKEAYDVYLMFDVDLNEEAIFKHIERINFGYFEKNGEPYDSPMVRGGAAKLKEGSKYDTYIRIKEIFCLIFGECSRLDYPSICEFVDEIKEDLSKVEPNEARSINLLEKIRKKIDVQMTKKADEKKKKKRKKNNPN